VLQTLARHGLDPGRLTLEITEGVLMRRPEVALRMMREIEKDWEKPPAGDYLRLAKTGMEYYQTPKPRWESLIANRPEIFLEDKGWALALHASNVPLADARELLACARQAAGEGLPENLFRWFDSSNFLELAPLQANKGETVNLLVKGYPYAGARLLYIGDDDKDEEAFEVVHAFGGLNIQVSDPENPILYAGADYVLNSPHEVRKWLKTLFIP